ncbi:hypothetical protein O1R50_23620 [Glycomyces luteolus]|uniref:Uncharacterized protein n=1 Tax=Glycomyces luteolus TaxID=2670330 RepID=A0A9X3PC40_9ACTN|nr:hypothetical protein [Glycomyces luteolus]MDA1362631.1 hypothetical protein [Glycomyces luteolus]
MNDDINDRLRVTAEEYEPDRDRMWSRVSEGMREPRVRAEPVRTGWRIPQLGLATGAALALIGAIVFFGQFLGFGPVIGPTPEPPAAGPGTRSAEATDPASSGGDDATTGGEEETSADDGESEGSEEETTEGESSPEVIDAPEWLWTDGSIDPNSNDYWTQSTLTLKNQEALTGLSVELRVAEGAGVEYTDAWTSGDSWFTEATVTKEDGFLVYRWTLQEGKVLPAGEYQLAGQYNHGAGARSADEDRYTFDAETESGGTGSVEGDFA